MSTDTQAENKKVQAKAKAVLHWGREWCLGAAQALVKFEHQSKKWRKKQINAFL